MSSLEFSVGSSSFKDKFLDVHRNRSSRNGGQGDDDSRDDSGELH